MEQSKPSSRLSRARKLVHGRKLDLSKHRSDHSSRSHHHREGEEEPEFDMATATRTWCIATVSIGAILSLFCLISGTYILKTNPAKLGAFLSISSKGKEALALINFALTLCIDGMMFVHSVSLRWTLYHEGRLEYNTNIRLFTSSKTVGPNRWYINVVALFFLVLSYGSSSVLFLSDETTLFSEMGDHGIPVMVNATALVGLGLGLAGQAAVAGWCLASGCKLVPTWSSNPLNTTLAAIRKGNFAHRPGRCMLSVHQKYLRPNQGVYPAEKQGSILQIQRSVRYILALLWALVILAIAWTVAMVTVSMSYGNQYAPIEGVTEPLPCWRFGINWNPDLSVCSINVVTLVMSQSGNTYKPNSATISYGAGAVLCVLFVCLVQSSQTIGLHCVELLVNLSRDEGAWRQAYGEKKQEAPGAQLSTNPFRAALSSWENIFLFVAKATLHWVMGQSMFASVIFGDETPGNNATSSPSSFMVAMIYSRLFIFSILALFLAIFATYLALKRSRGCQPATLGHLQTLADLIDDWKTDKNGRIWWGDKTRLLEADGGLRHAGTSWDKKTLSPVCTVARYAGARTESELKIGSVSYRTNNGKA
jgi:hypothetical protein